MNERIKELQELATDECGLNPSRFAELIVRECANYLDAFNLENRVEEGIGGAELKEHFGIEE